MLIDDLLLKCGILNNASLARSREIQRRDSVSLGKAIASLGLAAEEDVAQAVAQDLHLEYVTPDSVQVASDILKTLSTDFCRRSIVLPLQPGRRGIRLAMVNPLDYPLIQTIEFRIGKSLGIAVASEATILTALSAIEAASADADKVYNMLNVLNPAGEVEALQEVEHELVNPEALARDTKTPPIIRLVNMLLSEAVSAGASDIHIEPQEASVQVRYRVDGLLRDAIKIPRHLQDATISRLKIISGADIAERRKPQDGRTRLRYEGRRIDMRVSTLPTQFGEKVVIRLLDNRGGPRGIDNLDLSPANLELLQSLIQRPQGMLLVTGPTGSGKTSTIYSALEHIRSPQTNIITVEDPIEIQLHGINQVQVNPRAGVTFAIGLRSILRQDPNVILVGEIRDAETAAIACEASQTGHLLLSTLHTNDAPATITRLLDLNVEPFLVASSLIGILAQRLVRRTCPSCKVRKEPSPDAWLKSGAKTLMPDHGEWMSGAGCDQCGQTGFVGRIAIHEVLVVTDDVRELIMSKAAEHAIRKAARQQGMRTMMEDGVAKAAAGLTTLDEVVRIVSADAAIGASSQPASAPTTEELAGDLGRKLRVLVVEDSSTISTVVKYFLELDGFDVTVADDGSRGLALAKVELPDLIISDVNMPGLDGISMVRALRADPSTQGIPVLMLTAEDKVETEAEGLESGADDYILKPVEPRRLAARARAVLARHRIVKTR